MAPGTNIIFSVKLISFSVWFIYSAENGHHVDFKHYFR